jgi:hypothetical protein
VYGGGVGGSNKLVAVAAPAVAVAALIGSVVASGIIGAQRRWQALAALVGLTASAVALQPV